MSDGGSRQTVLLLGAFGPSLVTFWGPLISAVRTRGHRIIAAAEIDDQTAARLAELGAEPLSVSVARTGMNPVADLAYARDLARLFRRVQPDVLIAYTAKPVVWGALAASRTKIPCVIAMITGLGYAFTEGRGMKRRLARAALTWLYRMALKRCDGIIFQNPDDCRLFQSLDLLGAGTRVRIVNGAGVNTERFSPTALPREPAFLMIARLLGDKGVREYCTAALMLKRRYPQIPFRLLGWVDPSPDAIREPELQSWIAGGIEYLPRVDDVRPAIAACSVYVLPSYREGTPSSVLEAMAMGRAIVTTDAPGCRETILDGESGFLVPPRDPQALAAAMERFIKNPGCATVMGARSRARAEEKYDVRLVNADIMRHAGLL